MTVMRPADANETVEVWKEAIKRQGPVALILTRQNVPVLDLEKFPVREGVSKGAYVLSEAVKGKAEVILIATGSEVHLALSAQEELKKRNVKSRVVSTPSWELFEEQTEEYREEVLPKNVPKLAIEAGVPLGWHKYVGTNGDVIALKRFGASAPYETVYSKLGFNIENVVEHAIVLVGKK